MVSDADVVTFAGGDASYMELKWLSSKPITVQVVINDKIAFDYIPLFFVLVSLKCGTVGTGTADQASSTAHASGGRGWQCGTR
jgi:hypothetical protein